MTDLNKQKKATHRLLSAHFDFEGAEVSYTTDEVGGAASLKNDAYLFKSMVNESESLLTQAQSDTGASADDEKVSKSQTENKEDLMDQEIVKQLQDEVATLKAERDAAVLKAAVDAAETAFGKYELEAELVKELAGVFHTEGKELVVKALDAMVAQKEAAVEKASETVEEENPLAKALEEEAGHSEKQEPVGDTLLARVQKAKQIK